MNRRRGYAIYLIPGGIASTLVIVVPLVMTIGTSFTRWTGVGTPTWIGFQNYDRLFHDELFWSSFGHIILMVVAVLVWYVLEHTPVGRRMVATGAVVVVPGSVS